MPCGQDDGSDVSVGDEPRHAPPEPEPLLGRVDLALRVDVQPVASVQLLEYLIHAALVDALAAHNRQRLAQPKKERMIPVAEDDLTRAQSPSERGRVRIGEMRHWRYRT